MSRFYSGFSELLYQFESYRKSTDSWSRSFERQLRYFDAFCANSFPDMPLTQDMVDLWCRKRDTETNSTCNSRTRSVRALVKYVNARNICKIQLPPYLKKTPRTYIPHAFSSEELQRFFHECDYLELGSRITKTDIYRQMTIPVFFRLLYSSGLRTTEARLLKRHDVDLDHGIVNVESGKGYDQRYVALHESMNTLMQKYDSAADRLYPDREYFFESTRGGCYSPQWVTNNFKILWTKANGTDTDAVAYALRHHYAVTNINSWADDTFGYSKNLHYLSKSMGHRCIESTLYYYSIVPALADILMARSGEGMMRILPEVLYEEQE